MDSLKDKITKASESTNARFKRRKIRSMKRDFDKINEKLKESEKKLESIGPIEPPRDFAPGSYRALKLHPPNRNKPHYIFIISQLRLTSHPRSTVVLLDTETPGTSREIYSEDAEWLEHWVCNPGVASSSLTFGILTVNFSTGTRSFCVQ